MCPDAKWPGRPGGKETRKGREGREGGREREEAMAEAELAKARNGGQLAGNKPGATPYITTLMRGDKTN